MGRAIRNLKNYAATDKEPKQHIWKYALDYFDASINRISAWVVGFRNFQKALLNALLTPNETLKQLWEMATECPVVFPSGIGVVGWMVPGGREIAVATSALMKEYDVAIWAHHGMFCSGEDFDLTFGLMHTVEKSAEILVKMLSMRPDKRQTISPQNFRDLAKDFKVTLPEKFLYDK